MSRLSDKLNNHFYGASLIALAGYELLAYTTRLDTLTTQFRRHPRLRPLLLLYLLGVVRHVNQPDLTV